MRITECTCDIDTGCAQACTAIDTHTLLLLKSGLFILTVQVAPLAQSVPASQNLILALYSYCADELSFHKRSVISVLSKEGDWWKGELNSQVGLFPSNYVQGLSEQQQSTEATRCVYPHECTPSLSCPPSSLMTVPLPFFSLSDHHTGADSVTPDVLSIVSEQEAIFEVVTSLRG